MFRSRSISVRLKTPKNLVIIIISLIIIGSFVSIVWRQKSSEAAQAMDGEVVANVDTQAVDTDQSNKKEELEKISEVEKSDEVETLKTDDDKPVTAANLASTPSNTQPNRIPAVPSCSRAPHVLPQPIALANYSEGLTHIVDPTIYFQVYGRDTRTIQQQIWNCSPDIGKRFLHAISQSRIDVSYGKEMIDETGICRTTNVKVGLRTVVTLPTWQADEFTPEATRQAMQRFLAGINTHEAGHGNIDRSYAEKLLWQLRNLSAPCETLPTEVQRTLFDIQSQLQSAQHNYEIQTNYGANQGAWL